MENMVSKAVKNGTAKVPTKVGHKQKIKTFKNKSFKAAIYKVLKQLHPDIGISKKAVRDMDSFVKFMFDRIAMVASHLARCNNSSEINVREIDAAVRILITDHLGLHAVHEGNKAIAKETSCTCLHERQVSNPGSEEVALKKNTPYKAVEDGEVKMFTTVGDKKRRRSESFGVAIYKVLKKVHPDIGISKKAVRDMDSFLKFMFKRIAVVASHLARSKNSNEINAREIDAAVRLLVTDHLGLHAVHKENKAIAKEKKYTCLPKRQDRTPGSQETSPRNIPYEAVEKDGRAKMFTRVGDTKMRKRDSFGVSIYKVLKQLHPDIGISKKAVRDTDSFLKFMFKRIAVVASHLAHCNNSSEISVREIDAAVRILITGDLGRLAVHEGNRVISREKKGYTCYLEPFVTVSDQNCTCLPEQSVAVSDLNRTCIIDLAVFKQDITFDPEEFETQRPTSTWQWFQKHLTSRLRDVAVYGFGYDPKSKCEDSVAQWA